jgi:hypothetical protein
MYQHSVSRTPVRWGHVPRHERGRSDFSEHSTRSPRSSKRSAGSRSTGRTGYRSPDGATQLAYAGRDTTREAASSWTDRRKRSKPTRSCSRGCARDCSATTHTSDTFLPRHGICMRVGGDATSRCTKQSTLGRSTEEAPNRTLRSRRSPPVCVATGAVLCFDANHPYDRRRWTTPSGRQRLGRAVSMRADSVRRTRCCS